MMRKYSTITEVLSHSQPSYHGNICYHVKLSCGHASIRDFHKGVSPLKKRTICRICSKIDDLGKYEQSAGSDLAKKPR